MCRPSLILAPQPALRLMRAPRPGATSDPESGIGGHSAAARTPTDRRPAGHPPAPGVARSVAFGDDRPRSTGQWSPWREVSRVGGMGSLPVGDWPLSSGSVAFTVRQRPVREWGRQPHRSPPSGRAQRTHSN